MPALAIAPSELLARPFARLPPPMPRVSAAGIAAIRGLPPALPVPTVLAMVKRRASTPMPAPAPAPPPPPPPPGDWLIPGTIREPVGVLIRVAARAGGFSVQDLESPKRTKDVVKVRSVAFFLASRFTKSSLPQMGRKMGDRDHTTALHAIRKAEAAALALGDPAEDTPEAWAAHLLANPWPAYSQSKSA